MKRIVKLAGFVVLAFVCVCGGLGLAASRGAKDAPVKERGGVVEFATATSTPLPLPATFTPAPTDTKVPPTNTVTPPPTNTPAPPTATPVPLRLDVVSVTSPVKPNSTARAEIMTEPGVNCSIGVFYKSGASKAAGLEPMVAGDDGRCWWEWDVGPKTTPGEFHITFQVFLNGQHAEQRVPFVVTQ